jgi:hypothetical protein
MTKTSATLKGKRCLCPTCGEVFSTASNFDKHRKGDNAVGRHCIDPKMAGMLIRESNAGTFWAMPGREAIQA